MQHIPLNRLTNGSIVAGIVFKRNWCCVGGELKHNKFGIIKQIDKVSCTTVRLKGCADVSSVSISFLPYGGITYFINSLDQFN